MEIKETKEVIVALREIGVLGAKVFKDGKINFSDLKYLKELGNVISEFKKAIDNIKDVDDELKELSVVEAKELFSMVLETVKAIKNAE